MTSRKPAPLLPPLSHLPLSLFLTLMVSACGGGGSDQPGSDEPTGSMSVADQIQFPVDLDNDDYPGLIVTGLNGVAAENVASPWLVNLSLFRSNSEGAPPGDGNIDFVQYSDDFPVSAHVNFYRQRMDTCLVRGDNAPIGDDGGGGDAPPQISAGSPVFINSAESSPWFAFNAEIQDNGDVAYFADDELPGALPAGATLSAPGDMFPAISAHPLYEPEPIQRLLPDFDTPNSVNDEYSWIPGDENTRVVLDFLAFNEAGEFVGFPVTCWANDDGSFELTGAARTAIAEATDTLWLRYAREYARLDLVNGIVIYQEVQVAE